MDNGEGKEEAAPKAAGLNTRSGLPYGYGVVKTAAAPTASSSDVTTSTEVSKGKGVNTFTVHNFPVQKSIISRSKKAFGGTGARAPSPHHRPRPAPPPPTGPPGAHRAPPAGRPQPSAAIDPGDGGLEAAGS